MYLNTEYVSLELTGQQFCTLYGYIIQDLQNSSLDSINIMAANESETEMYLYAELEIQENTSYYYECTIPADAVKSVEYIKSLLNEA